MYRPQAQRLCFASAPTTRNAEAGKFGFDTYEEGELFTIFEAGFDHWLHATGTRTSSAFGDVHLSLWHQDELDEADVDDGWGIAGAAMQRFGRFTPFIRYGYADSGCQWSDSRSSTWRTWAWSWMESSDRANDRIGVGYTWSDPADSALDDQSTIDAYYRVQMTPEIQAVSPTLQVIFDPVRNSDEDMVYVWGIRTRIEF